MTSEIRANTLKNRVGLGTVSFTNTGIIVSGIVTANSFSGPLITTSIDLNGDLDVDGHTNLDNVNIVGVTTITKGTSGGATANTDASLILHNNNNNYIQILSPNNKEQGLLFGDDADNDAGNIIYDHSDNALTFATNGGTNERLRITSDGKIGVNYAGTPPSETMMIASADSTTGLSISHSSGGNRYGARLSTISGNNKGLIISNIFNSSYAEVFRINSNGDVTTTGQASFDRQNAFQSALDLEVHFHKRRRRLWALDTTAVQSLDVNLSRRERVQIIHRLLSQQDGVRQRIVHVSGAHGLVQVGILNLQKPGFDRRLCSRVHGHGGQ